MKQNYLHNGPIDPLQVEQRVSSDVKGETGAQLTFLGKVRADTIDGKVVGAIEYSAYATMVEAEFEKIRVEFLARYEDISAIEILHAVGEVAVNEVALAVVIRSGHRKDAFEAMPLLVDAIKERVPIWKKELFLNGGYIWTENK